MPMVIYSPTKGYLKGSSHSRLGRTIMNTWTSSLKKAQDFSKTDPEVFTANFGWVKTTSKDVVTLRGDRCSIRKQVIVLQVHQT